MKIGGFVFAVCGSREHIETLHMSLHVLQRYTRHAIWVVTDPVRNEIPVDWENSISVQTPTELSHHQASIYLKTSLHQHLPAGNRYAYLDSDVVAMNGEVDSIFDAFLSPIRFAADHCKIPQFSPHAVNCSCLDRFAADQKAFTQAQITPKNPADCEDREDLLQVLSELRRNPLLQIRESLRFLTQGNNYRLRARFRYNRETEIWENTRGAALLGSQKQIQRDSQNKVRYNWLKRAWINQAGERIWDIQCQHLSEQIKQDFGISVKQNRWQHWNGGVFIFGPESESFLTAWHTKTMAIFNKQEWKTRDQGTLIATVWEFHLQDHALLPQRFNFLADANNSNLRFDGQHWSLDGGRTFIEVNFAHIYHRWGDSNWPVWKALMPHLCHG